MEAIYRPICGVIECGAVVILAVILCLLESHFRAPYLIFIGICLLVSVYCNRHALTGSDGVPARKKAKNSALKSNTAESSQHSFVPCGRRRVQITGVRLVEAQLEYFQVLVLRESESWSIWRSRQQLRDLILMTNIVMI